MSRAFKPPKRPSISGEKNRLARRRLKIVAELEARGEARSVLRELAGHPDGKVRELAVSNINWLDRPSPESAPEARPKGPHWPRVAWQCEHAPPAALTRDEIAKRLRRSLPEFCDRLMSLALPAIGLWPQRRAKIAATASRFGGTPLAPPDWQWPTIEDEPLLFVGQINCAELRGLPGSELLPPSGLLAFFGDYDAVNGADRFGSVGVYHWPDVDRLVPARARVDPLEVFPPCALAPRPILELPHPSSDAVSELKLSKQHWQLYFDVWVENHEHGIPPDCVGYACLGKLLGWPALVQNDLSCFEAEVRTRLLLQVGSYCNGEAQHSWFRGGSLYYVLPERELRAGVFAGCGFEFQST